jgi:hypothetical protein
MNKICSLFNIKYPIIQVNDLGCGYKLANCIATQAV